MMYEGLFKN